MSFWILGLCWLLVPLPALAKTVAVQPGGLNAGIRQLSSGDTLLLASGQYSEKPDLCAIPSGTAGQPTILKADKPFGAVIQSSGIMLDWRGGCAPAYVTFDGLILDYGGKDGGNGWVFHVDVQGVTIQNGGCQNMLRKSVCMNLGKGVTVRGNRFWNLGTGDVASGDWCPTCFSYGIYLSNSDNVIEGNSFKNISAYSIHGFNGSGTPVSNNMIRKNAMCEVGTLLIGCQGTNNTVTDNLFYHVAQTGYPYDRGIPVRACVDGQHISNNQDAGSAAVCDSLLSVGTDTTTPGGRPPVPTLLHLLRTR